MIVIEAQIDDGEKSSSSQNIIYHHIVSMIFNANFHVRCASVIEDFLDDWTSTEVADHVPGELKLRSRIVIIFLDISPLCLGQFTEIGQPASAQLHRSYESLDPDGALKVSVVLQVYFHFLHVIGVVAREIFLKHEGL